MDDRLAKIFLENNLLQRQQNDERRLSLLEKLATNGLAFEQPQIPGVTPDAPLKKVFVEDEFAGFSATSYSDNSAPLVIGELGWTSNDLIYLVSTGISGFTNNEHYGVVLISNNISERGYIYLNSMFSSTMQILQFIVLSGLMLDAGDGCAFGLMDLGIVGPFEIDGSTIGIYFRREYTDSNWHAVTRDISGITDTDTGISFVHNTWFLFEIKQLGLGIITFYINQVLVATHTTNVDSVTALYPVFGMKDPGSAIAYGVTLDYFYMQLAPIIKRWD